jgi:hypothetical protein
MLLKYWLKKPTVLRLHEDNPSLQRKQKKGIRLDSLFLWGFVILWAGAKPRSTESLQYPALMLTHFAG